jgi:hypothetical protein
MDFQRKIRDRLSFMRFLWLGQLNAVPDAGFRHNEPPGAVQPVFGANAVRHCIFSGSSIWNSAASSESRQSMAQSFSNYRLGKVAFDKRLHNRQEK